MKVSFLFKISRWDQYEISGELFGKKQPLPVKFGSHDRLNNETSPHDYLLREDDLLPDDLFPEEDLREEDFPEDDFFFGTFAPFSRASLKPMAIACLGFVTFFPLRPLFNCPCFISCIASCTLS